MLIATCHCGDITLEIARRPRSLTACNCSICRRYGALWAYYTRKSITVTSARPNALTAYRRREDTLDFQHCARCGCVMFHERRRKAGDDTRIGVNTRMIAPDDLDGLPIRVLDGAGRWTYLGSARTYSAAAAGA